MEWSSGIEAGGAAVTALFTGILAVATARLWNSTKGLHVETKRLAALAETQSEDMKASIAIARKSADAAVSAQRPWLALDFSLNGGFQISPEMRYLHNHLGVHLNVSMRNFGNTPARDIYVKADITFYDTQGRPYSPVDCYLRPFLKSAADMVIPEYGGAIFPGKVHQAEGFAACAIADAQSLTVDAKPQDILVLVICSVSYAFDGGNGYTLGSAALTVPIDDLLKKVGTGPDVTPSAIAGHELALGEIEIYAR